MQCGIEETIGSVPFPNVPRFWRVKDENPWFGFVRRVVGLTIAGGSGVDRAGRGGSVNSYSLVLSSSSSRYPVVGNGWSRLSLFVSSWHDWEGLDAEKIGGGSSSK